MSKLDDINNELKDYINESAFISNKCRNKVIAMLGEEFDIKFSLDNYKTIDVTIKEDGHIIMRGDEYSPDKDMNLEEIVERYNKFKVKADNFLKKKNISFENKKIGSNILNILVLLIVFIITILLVIYGIKSLLRGDLQSLIWLIFVVFIWIIPSISNNLRSRIQTAYIFIKNLFKK